VSSVCPTALTESSTSRALRIQASGKARVRPAWSRSPSGQRATRAGVLRPRDRVLHERPADSVASPRRAHDEMIEVGLFARQRREHAQGHHPDDLTLLLGDVGRRVGGPVPRRPRRGASAEPGRPIDLSLPMGEFRLPGLHPPRDYRWRRPGSRSSRLGQRPARGSVASTLPFLSRASIATTDGNGPRVVEAKRFSLTGAETTVLPETSIPTTLATPSAAKPAN